MDDKKKAGRPYILFFAGICALFIGLLIYVYNGTRKAHPVALDEHGQVVAHH